MTRPARTGSNTGYLNRDANMDDMTLRIIEARNGSARLLAALVRHHGLGVKG